jgi:6-phosphogluconolactonase
LNKSVNIFSTSSELAKTLAEDLIIRICEAGEKTKTISIALSGGSTPQLLYSILGEHYSNSAPWEYVQFFWGDERCVPGDHPESNYGMAKSNFFDKITIPASNIHRIRGDEDPAKEAIRYSGEILSNIPVRYGLPSFDIILLGLGEDGHTASIFPENMDLLFSDRICEVTVHPVSFQKRITVTGKVINNSGSVIFLVTGKKKAEIVSEVIKRTSSVNKFPASYIDPGHGELRWLIDIEAGRLL